MTFYLCFFQPKNRQQGTSEFQDSLQSSYTRLKKAVGVSSLPFLLHNCGIPEEVCALLCTPGQVTPWAEVLWDFVCCVVEVGREQAFLPSCLTLPVLSSFFENYRQERKESQSTPSTRACPTVFTAPWLLVLFDFGFSFVLFTTIIELMKCTRKLDVEIDEQRA